MYLHIFHLIILAAVIGLLARFIIGLIRYGEQKEINKNTKAELEVEKRNMEATREVALDSPANDDDVLARLRGDKDSK